MRRKTLFFRISLLLIVLVLIALGMLRTFNTQWIGCTAIPIGDIKLRQCNHIRSLSAKTNENVLITLSPGEQLFFAGWTTDNQYHVEGYNNNADDAEKVEVNLNEVDTNIAAPNYYISTILNGSEQQEESQECSTLITAIDDIHKQGIKQIDDTGILEFLQCKNS